LQRVYLHCTVVVLQITHQHVASQQDSMHMTAARNAGHGIIPLLLFFSGRVRVMHMAITDAQAGMTSSKARVPLASS
jgi:hypothetical protein